MNIYLSENIKKLRKGKELTQERLAEFLGVTFQSISNWERGESFPDITMLPEIASFFKVTVDELLGLNKTQAQIKIEEYLNIYNNKRFNDTKFAFTSLSNAVKEFPSDYRITVRYMELLMLEKTPNSPDYEKASRELFSIYENIRQNCTDDSIRMWAKRLICQHLHTKAHYTGNEDYQIECESILSEMPDLINSKDYLSTMLISDKEKHYEACSRSIENMLFLLEHSVDHYCLYDDSFDAEYKICALEKMLKIYELIFEGGNFGKLWHDVIYNHGHLGYLYAGIDENDKAINHLRLSAEYAKLYDELPDNTEYNCQFFEKRNFSKTPYATTMCKRMHYLITEKYQLSEELRNRSDYQKIISSLK